MLYRLVLTPLESTRRMSMNRRAFAFTFLLLLWRSDAASDEVPFSILPAAEATVLQLALCSRKSPEGISSGWDPTPSQVDDAEALLPGFIVMNRRPIWPPLGEYYRQYLGVVIDGKKVIYVNLFDRKGHDEFLEDREPLRPDGSEWPDWRTEFQVACDGWDCDWGVLFDPATLRFSSPEFNAI